jgi:CubicO group peptidase (beta-lactamase class C family)
MMRYRSFVALTLFLLHSFGASIVSAQTDQIDDYIQIEMKKRQIPGLALVVIRDGEVIKMKGYGFANLEHDVPVTPDTVFELASVTKQFTAAAVMVLVEESKIRVEDPIGRYLPNSPEHWKDITARHLLTHTAGLPNLENGFQALRKGGPRLNYTTTQLFNAAKSDPMSFAPGERWQYSDVGYFLLGMIIEKVSGQRYRNFLASRFFEPSGMASTSVLDQWVVLKNRAAGYTLRNGQIVNIRRIIQVELPSHYGIFSTVRDLVKWDNALATGKVLKQSSLEQMWTPVKLNSGGSFPYGFGWEMDERRGHRMITHTGITGTEYTRFPDDKLTVIVLTNLGRHIGATEVNSWGLTKGVAGRFIPNLLLSSLKEQPDINQHLTQTLRNFLSNMAKGEDAALMTPGLRARRSGASGANIAGRLQELKSFTFLTCDEIEGRVVERFGAQVSRTCYYKMVTGSETRYYRFLLTSDEKVADFSSFVE